MASNSESLSQVQQQRLQQRLNPQNVALGRLLAMGVTEFEDEIRRELDDNPALEAVATQTPEEREETFGETAEELQRADYGNDDDMPAYLGGSHTGRGGDGSGIDPGVLAVDEGDSLFDTLMLRLANEYELDADDVPVAAAIIGNLDDNGYLTRPLSALADDLAISDGIYVEPERIRKVFDAVRRLDPAGIGATDLRDCLLLQIDRKPPTVTSLTAREIIANYFDLFSKKHYDRLQSALDISRTALTEALDYIRTLNPKPASVLDLDRRADRARHIVPDFSLEYDEDADTFTVSLLGHTPELGIEATFASDFGDSDARAFIKKKRDEAGNFIRLVEMRSHTLMAIMKAIATLQRTFFITGDKADIRPMILRDVASVTGLDLPVISRATAGKYVVTAHGVYPLKLFFNERPGNDADVSSHEILKALEEIIASEDKSSPLSDRDLCEELARRGYELARRTVAKYRERIGQPVARLRKQF